MNHKEFQEKLSNLSDMLSKIPLIIEIRHDVAKCEEADEAISQVLIGVDNLLDKVENETISQWNETP